MMWLDLTATDDSGKLKEMESRCNERISNDNALNGNFAAASMGQVIRLSRKILRIPVRTFYHHNYHSFEGLPTMPTEITQRRGY